MKYLILTLSLFLSACNSSPSTNLTDAMNLIVLTESNAPNAIEGSFKFKIKASGVKGGEVFLNTELDYRDRRSITVTIAPHVASVLLEKYGATPETFFVNKTVAVTGEAKRVKIYFISNGMLTNKYYFQTHINVPSIDNITVVG